MGVQQASLFNLPPEEQKPVAKKGAHPKEIVDEELPFNDPTEEEAAIEESGVAIETFATPMKVTPPAPEDAIVAADPNEDAIVVDGQVRELDLVVRNSKLNSSAVVTGKRSTRGRIRLSDMDDLVDLVDVPVDDILFQKRYYSIGTVSDMFKVNISLIRFWENEFDILKPKKNAKGDRLFRPEDIKNLQLIYHLLREKKYTLDGAKDFLKNNKRAEESFGAIESLKKIKSFLLELKANL